MFRNRTDAARRLATRLRPLAGEDPLILAVPRGGVPMGSVLAHELDGDLDVLLVRKVPAPGNPEYAVGAVSEDGTLYAPAEATARYGDDYLRQAAAEQADVLRKRRQRYTPARQPIDPAGRVAIVVDDGCATGATMEAALAVLNKRRPGRTIVALGAAPPDVVSRLETLADNVVCLEVTPDFGAVGQFYADFSQVSDDEVVSLLQRAGTHQPPDPAART